jgi:hypothetical protein
MARIVLALRELGDKVARVAEGAQLAAAGERGTGSSKVRDQPLSGMPLSCRPVMH